MIASTYAQEANVGLKVGLNFAEWSGADVENLADIHSDNPTSTNAFIFGKFTDNESIKVDGKLNSRMGVHAGFQINSEVNDYFWLKHEFIFATKGFSFTGTKYEFDASDSTNSIETPNTELRYRSYHVDIFPVSLAGHYEGLQLFAGPFVSVMLASSWVEKNNAIVTTPANEDFNYYTRFNTVNQTGGPRTLGILDYGFVAGFEYELPFGLHAGIRYVQGFASVLETPEGEARTNAFNKDIRVSLGYTFGKDD